MVQRKSNRLSMRVLVVDDELGTPTAEGRAIRTLVEELRRSHRVNPRRLLAGRSARS